MPRAHQPPCRQRGFTLLELFVVIAVAAILAAAALPGLQEFIKNNNRSTRMNTLVTALNYARSDAVNRRRTTTVCPTDNQCSCAGDAEFHSGVLVRIGVGVAEPAPCSAANAPLRYFRMDTSAAFTLLGTGPGAVPAPALTQVDFGPAGRATTNVGGSVAGSTFTYCDDRGADDARAVVLSASGQPRTTTGGLTCP